ncbi:MAG: response regulator transcription factor [Coriobacteriia bacterium]|nr:response regulator transcription factor [Coriobacteriia bacterium]
MDPVRVFIADDHELVRYALRMLLENEPDIVVVGESADGEGAVEAVAQGGVDLVLLDLRMPGIGGIEACRQIKERAPDVPVLVLTSFGDDDEVFGVLAAGAGGYILKDTRPELVVQAVRAMAEGQAVFDSKIAARVIAGQPERDPDPDEELRSRFSERELEVLQLMAEGMGNKQIAHALWISEATVKTHVSHILRKMGIADRTQAALLAVRSGLVTQPDGDAG